MARRKDRPAGPLDPRSQADPAGRHRGIRRYRRAGRQPDAGRALPARRQLGHGPQRDGRARGSRLPDPPAHQRRPRADRRRLPRCTSSRSRRSISLAPVERLMIRHQFGQVEFASEQWFRLAAATIAGATHAAGLATPAKPRACRLRHVDLVATSAHTASLVVVLAEGSVKQELIPLEDGYDQHELDDVARLLNDELAGKSARQVANAAGGAERRAGAAGADAARRAADRADDARVRCRGGRGRLLATACSTSWRRPSSARARSCAASSPCCRTATTSARSCARLASAPGRAGADRRGERARPRCRTCRSCSPRTASPVARMGVVGVLGPTRMAYPHAIGTVRYVSGLMNELVEQLYR